VQGRKNHCRSLKQVCNRARKPLSYKTQGERELAQNQPQTAYNLQNHHHQQMAASNDLHTNCSNTTAATPPQHMHAAYARRCAYTGANAH
jgi:hypothetical protein